MTSNIPDPIRSASQLMAPDASDALERRMKEDIFNSIARIKPDVTASVDFEDDVMSGRFFEDLSAPLQGIAIARTEGALAFYNRVGWDPRFLDTPLEGWVPEEGIEPLTTRYHARTLHDLAYVHPKHFVKMLGQSGAATLWESLKRFTQGKRSQDESTQGKNTQGNLPE